nr:ImmA/IrrE family metallo-endopeptidase [Thalassospira sp.]
MELRREEHLDPQQIVIFECKNYSGAVPDTVIREFSDKLSDIGRDNTKGIIVVTSRLQSGAEKVARSRKLGIIKYNPHGLEFLAERRFTDDLKSKHAKASMLGSDSRFRSLKFAAYFSGKYYDNARNFLSAVAGETLEKSEVQVLSKSQFPYLHADDIEKSTSQLHTMIGYDDGPVDLEKICEQLAIDLTMSAGSGDTDDENELLGRADFANKKIAIYAHGNRKRERFTLAHEIGHFHLNHDKFLRSETTIKQDLVVDERETKGNLINRMEYQANMFASHLLLPKFNLVKKVQELRVKLDIRDRGHGYIFVDNQPQNLSNYYLLLAAVSEHFNTSSQVIEIRLKSLGCITDNRKQPQNFVADFRQTCPN